MAIGRPAGRRCLAEDGNRGYGQAKVDDRRHCERRTDPAWQLTRWVVKASDQRGDGLPARE
jgi:hypothetical protein